MQNLLIFILAAGKGTRMQRHMPKTLHPIAGLPLVGHVLQMANELTQQYPHSNHHIGLVLSPENHDEISRHFPDSVSHIQAKQNGTGDAVKSALDDYQQQNNATQQEGVVLVLYGDTPFITVAIAQQLIQAVEQSDALAVLGFRAQNPASYGRLISDGKHVTQIIEAKDLPAEHDNVDLCNAGVMAMNVTKLQDWLQRLDNNNASSEYYLTDLVGFAHEDGAKIPLILADEKAVMGVNSLAELAQAEYYWQQQKRQNLMAQGVMMQAPETVFFSHDTQIASNTLLEPNLFFGKNVTIDEGAHIKAFCHIEGAHIGKNASIGPFARLRPGSDLAENVSIGNFVEIKNSKLAKGVKAGHLSYLGDAEIGANSNIGAGTITCNYNGFSKAKTTLGENVFIGSNSALVAPINIGNDALIGAGSVLSKNIGDDEMATSRTPQRNIAGRGMKSRKENQ